MNVTFEENGASLDATERSCRFMWILAVSFDLLHVWRWSCTIIFQHADDGFLLLYQVTSSAQWLWDWSQRWLIPNVREGLEAAQSVMGYVEMLAFFHNKSTTDIALKKHLGRRVHIAVGVTQFQSHPLVINELNVITTLGRRWMEHAGYVGEHQDMSGDDSSRWFDWLYMAPIIEMHKARNTTKRHTCPPMIWLYKVQCTVPDLFKLYLHTDLYVYNFTCVYHGK